VSDDTEAFARVRLNEHGHVVDFTFGGIRLSVSSLEEARLYVRRHAMNSGHESVLTVTAPDGEESQIFSTLGEANPYLGPVPDHDGADDDMLSMGFAEAFDESGPRTVGLPDAQETVPARPETQPTTGEYTPPDERIDKTEDWQPPQRTAAPRMPPNPFGDLADLDMSDFESEDVSSFEAGLGKQKKKRRGKRTAGKSTRVKPKRERPSEENLPAGEAAEADEAQAPDILDAQTTTSRRREVSPRTVMGILAGGLAAVLAIGVVSGVTTGVIPNPLAAQNEEEQVGEEADTTMQLSTPDDLPGFDMGNPAYQFDVPSTAAVTASDRATVVVDQQEVWLYETETGTEIFHDEADAEVAFTVDTVVDDEPALAWRAGDELFVHLDSAPSKPLTVKLPKKAQVSSAGERLLISSEDSSEHYTLSSDALRELDVPDNAGTVMAVDADGALAAGFNTPVTVLDDDGTTVRTVELTPPSPSMGMSQWLSAGHGLAVIAWSTRQSSQSPDQPITVGVHSLDTGEVSSSVATTQGELAEWKWTRGQGYDRAALGPYAFDMNTGALVADGSTIDAHITGAAGSLLLGQTPDGTFAAHGLSAHPTDLTPLAVVDDDGLALARTDQTTVAAYPATEEEQS
jgi:hypothetical protein